MKCEKKRKSLDIFIHCWIKTTWTGIEIWNHPHETKKFVTNAQEHLLIELVGYQHISCPERIKYICSGIQWCLPFMPETIDLQCISCQVCQRLARIKSLGWSVKLYKTLNGYWLKRENSLLTSRILMWFKVFYTCNELEQNSSSVRPCLSIPSWRVSGFTSSYLSNFCRSNIHPHQ